jgi:hypothetical protein
MTTNVRTAVVALLGLVFLLGGAASAGAQVKQVQMHIAGYLCGN